jgi:hypothetical protein
LRCHQGIVGDCCLSFTQQLPRHLDLSRAKAAGAEAPLRRCFGACRLWSMWGAAQFGDAH